ncbi:MAG TPA: hypothetical protein VJA47_01785, partial [archaeon]|nr:hypothetical protein [archaeon]
MKKLILLIAVMILFSGCATQPAATTPSNTVQINQTNEPTQTNYQTSQPTPTVTKTTLTKVNYPSDKPVFTANTKIQGKYNLIG